MGLFSKRRERQQIFFDTDIHCHVLPGIDDGSPDVDTSVQLVERMHSWGINRIIASPHITDITFPNTPDTIGKAFADLKAALAAAQCPVKLSHSAENRIDDLFLKNFADGTLFTMPGKLLLLENSFIQEPWDLDRLLFEVQVKGYQPILVHPERYSYYYSRHSRYQAIHATGTMFQINLLSLTGYYGKTEKKEAEWLAENGMVDFIGTDLHRHSHADVIEEYLCSKDYERHRALLARKVRNASIPADE